MDLTDLWWTAVGFFFLLGPFVLAAFSGLALPVGAMALASGGQRWSDESKLAVLLSILILAPAIGTIVSGRVFYTEREVMLNPTLTAAMDSSSLTEWTTRVGAAGLLAIATLEIVRWLMGAKYLHTQAKQLLMAALLYYASSVVLAGIHGEFRFFRLHVLYMPVLLTGLALLSMSELSRPLIGLRWSLWLIMVGCLAAAVVAPRLALEMDYESLFPGVTWRLVGLSDSPNSLGALAVISLVLELSSGVVTRPRWWVLLPAAAVLVLSQSKTAWVEALLVMSLIGTVRIKHALFRVDDPRASVAMWALGAFAAALLFIAGGALVESDKAVAWIENSGLTTLTGRTSIWAVTLAEFERSPWLGYGPALWDVQYRYEHGMMHVGHAHNQFIHTLGQAGLVGAGSLLLYVGLMCRLCWASWKAGFVLPLVALMILLVRSMTEAPLIMGSIIGTDALCHALTFYLAVASSAHAAPVEEYEPCDA